VSFGAPAVVISFRQAIELPKTTCVPANIPQVEGRGLFRKFFEDFKAEGLFAVSVPLRLQLLVAMKALALLEELAFLRGVEVG
jgi:hypothetical protein